MLLRIAWLLVLAWPTSAIALSIGPGGGSLFTLVSVIAPGCSDQSEFGVPVVPEGGGGPFGANVSCSSTSFGTADVLSWTMTTDSFNFDFALEAVGATYTLSSVQAGLLIEVADSSDAIVIALENLDHPTFGMNWSIEDLLSRQVVSRGSVDGSPITGLPPGNYFLRFSGDVLALPTQNAEFASGTASVSLIAVPEPSTAALVTTGLAVSGIRRRSRVRVGTAPPAPAT